MKVYLDNCSLQRPLDDKSQLRIRLEAEAVLSVFDVVKAGRIQLVSSDALDFEIGRNPNPTRYDFASEIVAGATTHVRLTQAVQSRAHELNQKGIDTLDSLHLASAEEAEVDLFCTCDDMFLKTAKREVRGRTKVVSPIELAEAIELWQSQQGP
jgi:hypothetical protein